MTIYEQCLLSIAHAACSFYIHCSINDYQVWDRIYWRLVAEIRAEMTHRLAKLFQ